MLYGFFYSGISIEKECLTNFSVYKVLHWKEMLYVYMFYTKIFVFPLIEILPNLVDAVKLLQIHQVFLIYLQIQIQQRGDFFCIRTTK